MKKIKVDRSSTPKVSPPSLHVSTLEKVEWTIYKGLTISIEADERLIFKSLDTDTRFSTLSATGDPGVPTISVDIPNPLGLVLNHDLPYEISVQKVPPLPDLPLSPVPVISDKLVIDTIGPPINPCLPEGEDEPAEDDYGCEEQN